MLEVKKNFRRYLAAVLAAVFVIASLPLTSFNVSAADTEGTCGDNLAWSYDADTTTLTITGYGDMTGWSKTKAPWYSYRSEITTVVFDCTDEEAGIGLGKYAFSGCSEITGMDLSDVTSIGNYTFFNCSSIVSLDISNVTSIDGYAFSGCSSLTEITVPEAITTVGEGMFQNCTSLEKVTFLGTVTEIDNIAFYNCASLTTIVWSEDDTSTGVTIPASVETVGTQAFYSCSSLESVAFEGKSVSFTEATKKKYGQFYGCTSLTSLTLPSEQDTIPAYFLEECTSLAQIEIPSTVTAIGKYAFYDTGLTSVTIPAAVASMGERVFSNCTALETVTFEEGIEIETIPTYLFEACSTLYEVVLPDSVTTIGAYAFKDCTSLASLTFGAGTQSIEIYALYGCSNADLELHFTCEYTSSLDIDDDAFSGITAVAYYPADSEAWPASDAVTQNLQYGATELTWAAEGEEVVRATWWDISEDETTLYIYLDGDMVNYTAGRAPWYSYRSTITEIVFGVNPNAEEGDDTTYTLTSIGSYAFYNFTALESIEIPASVTSIGNYAFAGCTGTEITEAQSGEFTYSGNSISGLTTVTFEEESQLTSIGDYAFYGCFFLEDITLPSSVTGIGDYIFAECGTSITSSVFSYVLGSGDTSNASVSLEFLIGDYGSTAVVTSIVIGDTELSSDDYTYSYSSGNNWMYSYVNFSSEALEQFDEGVYTGYIQYENFTLPFIFYIYSSDPTDDEEDAVIYYGLASIDLSNIETIGSHAFYKCCTLSSVTFGDQLTSIGDNAFASCGNLGSVTLPESLLAIGNRAFADSGLTEVNIPLNAEVGSYAFSGCSSLTSASFDAVDTTTEGSVSLGTAAFDSCTALTEITLPSEITTLSSYLFEDCTSLITVHFEGEVTTIGEGAFTGCTALSHLEGLGSVTSIGDEAFYECSALTSLDLPESLGNDDVGDFAFYNCEGLADDNGFVIVNNVIYSYVYDTMGVDVVSSSTTATEDDIVNVVISTVDVPETVTEIANYAFYQIYTAGSGTSASAAVSTVALEGLRFNVSADNVTLEEYSLAGLYETTYIYYSCIYADGWEAALETIGYTGTGESLGQYRYDTSWSVTGVTEHSLGDEPDSWNWAENYWSAEAVYVCSACGEEVTYEADITAEETSTCTEGITIYTATITDDNGNTFTDIQTVETEPAGHVYGDVVWAWSEDYTSASAAVTCMVCGNTVSGDAEVTSEETDGRTCVTASVTLEETEYMTFVWFTSSAADLTLSVSELEMSKMVTSTVYAILNETFTVDDETYDLVGWTGTITAESSDESVVTVETDGLEIIITGVSEGTATITVYAGEDVVGTIEVTSITVDCEGNHTWDEGVVTKEATCTEDGYEVWVCTVCGYVDVEATQSAFGHTYVLTDSKEATCDEEGYETYTCSTCGETYTDILEKIAHTYERTYQEPTCTEEGLYVYTCTVCGESYSVSSGESATGHTAAAEVVENVIEATCTTDGSYDSVVYCTVCGEELSRETVTAAATGHSFTSYVSNGDATCDADGTKTAVCDNGCGTTDTVTDEGSAISHSWTSVTVSAGSYGSTKETYTCSVCGEEKTVTSLYGSSRYETASDIVASTFESCTYAVIADGSNFPDALAAASLAGAVDAPILITSDSRIQDTIEELKSLGVTYVYIVGGTSSVSAGAMSAIEAEGIEVERIAGDTRQLTAVAVAEKVLSITGTSDVCLVATGKTYADALAASPYAYWSESPIYLTKNDGSISDEVLASIKAAGYSRIIILGGTSSVTEATEETLSEIASVTRLGGDTRYETAAIIAAWSVEQGMSCDGLTVATGTNYPDALTASVLCGKNGSVLLLSAATVEASTVLEEAIDANADNISNIYIVGGYSSVNKGIREMITDALIK